MTVRELLARMDSRELSEWLAYDRIEPLHDPYWVGGMICATMANLWASKRYGPADFMPAARAGAAEMQSPEEGIARMNALVAAMNARAGG